jgi:hypothetical protein
LVADVAATDCSPLGSAEPLGSALATTHRAVP